MMSDELYTSINIINALSDQISAVLDLMMMAESSVDHQSINTAAEMVLTMHGELMAEVDKITNAVRGYEQLKEQK